MYKLSTKISGKWRTLGNIKPNNYGNLSLGMRKTPELIEWFESVGEGQWLNLSLFEDKPKEQSPHNEAKQNGYQPQNELNNKAPF